ncbi:MAG: hypothetical protein Q8P72_00665 [Candidatus Roizmanbacteria bacterium]|nr:hypothetical protein [Candidatus Roizmanbacteria bacterium]
MLNVKTTIKPNPGKQIEIEVDGKIFSRYPIKTELFQKGDDYSSKIAKHVQTVFACHPEENPKDPEEHGFFAHAQNDNQKWYVVVSEKIVAISQGRSYFIKDIKPSWWATTLSKFVKRTPHGIGLGSPWTMELAIREVGLPRILLASLLSILTKPLGLQGVFYHVAGRRAAAIDGPTSYSLYPSNVSAKLAPKDPQGAAQKIRENIEYGIKNMESGAEFGGVVIIDANDLGRNVLGNATDKPDSFFEEVMRDNPMGQGSEQTPIVIVV